MERKLALMDIFLVRKMGGTCDAIVLLHRTNAMVTKQLLANVIKTLQNGWILVQMLSFLLVAFMFFLMGFQLVFIHENQQLKTNINEMFENGCK